MSYKLFSTAEGRGDLMIEPDVSDNPAGPAGLVPLAPADTADTAHAAKAPTNESRGDMPRLRFVDVSHTYPDGTKTLDHVDLTISRGEFVAVIGPSGCGKSTLLRLASGLLTANAGEVYGSRDDVGFVFQEATLLPYRTVLRNVELFAELHHMKKKEREALAREALSLVGLDGFEKKYPKALSGGMKMRTSLARSLVLHPTLFLFDEPFAAVDEITRQRLNDELMRLFTLEGFAAIYITHSISEACYVASRVIVMSDRPARIVAEVPIPFEYPRPESLRYEPEFVERAGEVSELLRSAGT